MADNTDAIAWLESKGDALYGDARPSQLWECYQARDLVGVLLPNDQRLPEAVRKYARYQRDEAIAEAGGVDAVRYETTPGASDFADSYQGKFVPLWHYWLKYDAAGMSGAQATGDCVSWGTRCAIDIRRSIGAVARARRELLAEGAEANTAGFRGAVFARAERYYKRQATAVLYMGRGHNGQGASPSRISNYACKVPIAFEENYGGKWDFSNYRDYVRLGMNYGRSGPPDELVSLLREKNGDAGAKRFKIISDPTAGLDAMAAQYPSHLGSGMGVSKRGDPISGLSGSWSHDMGVVGFDARESTVAKFGQVIVFMDQSWGKWNSVTDLLPDWLPWGEGMFALRFSDWARHVRSGELCVCLEAEGVELVDPAPWDENPWFPWRPERKADEQFATSA